MTSRLALVYERVPEDVDPDQAFAEDPELRADAEDAAREADKLRSLEPPEEIADAFQLFTSQPLPPPVGTDEYDAYEEARSGLEEFLRSDCDVDPDTLAALTAA
jgi:hypothetical protein